jgi:hypothetical protein
MAPHSGVYSPNDLEFLQGIYDQATDGLASIDDITMVEIAHALLDAYDKGIKERSQLLGIATRTLYRRTA